MYPAMQTYSLRWTSSKDFAFDNDSIVQKDSYSSAVILEIEAYYKSIVIF